MSSNAAKKGMRGAPRYMFSEGDVRHIRFASDKNQKIILTHIIDISESGISFTTTHKLCPRIGEMIKMDFAPPGTMQIAVRGRVVRVEEPTTNSDWAKFPGTLKVGVAFHDVPRAYKKVLNKTLSGLLEVRKSLKVQKSVSRKHYETPWILENAGSVVTAIGLTLAFIGLAYYMMNHMDTKNLREESPWAQNFFNRTIPAKK